MPAHDYDDKGGVTAWVRRWWRALLAELVSTALLVWLGLAAAVPVPHGDSSRPLPPAPLTHVAAAFGFVVVGNAVAFGHVSGAHMNPAVTLAAVITGQLRAAPAAAYAVAQCVGATLGFQALMASHYTLLEHGLGCTDAHVGAMPALLLEAALTFLLAMACCAAWAAPPDQTVPLKIGLLVAGLVFAGGAGTGASLNPARSLGPAIVHNHWDNHWVYWVGPLSGAALAAVLHRWVLTPPATARSAPEDLPLADKP